MDIKTNVFCASGMHLPDGSYVAFRGNGAVPVGGSDLNPGGFSALFDQTYRDFNRTKITNAEDMSSPQRLRSDDPLTTNSLSFSFPSFFLFFFLFFLFFNDFPPNPFSTTYASASKEEKGHNGPVRIIHQVLINNNMTTPAKSAISKSSNSKSLHDYQLGDSWGKGAFSQVYCALNWATGETVAVKEITLANIPKSELGEIMSEIDLLKNLNLDCVWRRGFASEPTFEEYPRTRETPQLMQFMFDTSSLNAYAHTYLKKSRKMFLQANLGRLISFSETIIFSFWDPDTNPETPLPDMPDGIVRVYPASGAVAMLPLTPSNNWNPIILFCGGNDTDNKAWETTPGPSSILGEKLHPPLAIVSLPNRKTAPHPPTPKATPCSNLVPWVNSSFFPPEKLLIVNGGPNGTAGYANQTLLTESFSKFSNMPFSMSLASGLMVRVSGPNSGTL
ncbi:hypothetical protein K435DRAFT_966254 [Dendrothele bispora CBS 962.96]|uniref:Protein kinase domain-containing protein n=1 Tax=Dendrothele bispora (strain CBS 962.96) TaxID=1314807 RepID=A0A4S8M127_DENBC|nr:hypothetical protein K435DRAFT_966254 [Dendrothele bispora CBS 962.96]